LNIEPKKIKLFIGKHPFLHGEYTEDYVFIDLFALDDGDFAKLLNLYMHEICHSIGPNESVEFTYVYTKLNEV